MSAFWARPGVECECISAIWRRGSSIPLFTWLRLLCMGMPIIGGRYIIVAAAQHAENGQIYVQLRGFGGVWFHVANFRPVIKRSAEQDLAMFTPLLDPSLPLVTDDAPQVPA